LGIVGITLCLPAFPARAEVAFERMEVTLAHPITGWLHGDINRDGDSDLLLLHQRNGLGAPTHAATFVRQNPTGRYDFPGRQVFGLQDSGGVYEMADVAGNDVAVGMRPSPWPIFPKVTPASWKPWSFPRTSRSGSWSSAFCRER
jgi:hypothetical protein